MSGILPSMFDLQRALAPARQAQPAPPQDWTDRVMEQWQRFPPNPQGAGDFPNAQQAGMASRDLLQGANPKEAINPDQAQPPGGMMRVQGALGSRVPPDTMMDSPQFPAGPDTKGEKSEHPLSSRQQERDRLLARSNELNEQSHALSRQLDLLPMGTPEWQRVFNQYIQTGELFRQNHEAYKATVDWLYRAGEQKNNVAPDADVMQRAIQERQNQPREPLPPPAPGGMLPNASTRDLSS